MRRVLGNPLTLAAVAAALEIAAYLALRATWHASFGPQLMLTESAGVTTGYAVLVSAGLSSTLLGSASAYRAVLTLRPPVATVFVAFVAAPIVFAATAATYATLALLALI